MIIPSIDIMNGKAVQLVSGKDKEIERENPMAIAEEFSIYGELAVIDLDAAMGRGENLELIQSIISKYPARVGGGIRDIPKARELIARGASKIIIGTAAFKNSDINREFLKALVQAIGKERIIIAIDTRHEKIARNGWQHSTGINPIEAVPKLESYASELLFTNIEKEGRMKGYDSMMVQQLRKLWRGPMTIAGGISTCDEIMTLTENQLDVQLGMAIYTGKLNLNDAFIAALNWRSTLLPVITRDRNGQVLMLAYTNREALRKTLSQRKMCYYSRSRQKLWTKGDSSGNVQRLVRLQVDCDRDTLLATVDQQGRACHKDRYSCFEDKAFSLTTLQGIIKERIESKQPGSYTAKLDREMVRRKINEEAYELVTAVKRDEIIWESADLLYFMTVLLSRENVDISEVFTELRRRQKQGGKK